MPSTGKNKNSTSTNDIELEVQDSMIAAPEFQFVIKPPKQKQNKSEGEKKES